LAEKDLAEIKGLLVHQVFRELQDYPVTQVYPEQLVYLANKAHRVHLDLTAGPVQKETKDYEDQTDVPVQQDVLALMVLMA
jgi:hypothetical protein